MALKSDRSTLQTDISFFMNEAATRGGVAALSTGGSGASMDNGAALVTYATLPSGKVPMGLLINDMVDIDLTRQHLNQHKDEAYLGHSGNLSTTDLSSDDTDADGSTRIVGRFTSDVDQNGYAKVFIDLPNTNS